MRKGNVKTNEKEGLNEKKTRKTNIDIRKLISLIISLITIGMSIALVVTMIKIGILPFKYMIALVLGLLLLGLVGFVDYGITGILTIIVFYLFRNIKFGKVLQLISFILLYIVFFKGLGIVINLFDFEFFLPMQSFCILSLIPIWLYNGEKGKKNKILQYGFYAFYPVHMLALYLIYYFCF